MEILYHKNFLKNYRKRILPHRALNSQFKKRLKLFQDNPKNPILREHRLLGGKKNYRAFSVTGDIRVIYKKSNGTILLYDIDTHNQVY